MSRIRSLSTLPILALLAGCPEPDPEVCEPDTVRSVEVSEERAVLVSDNDAFAWNLYHQLRSDSENLFFSPLSISAALDMTRLGARGETLEEMASVLGTSQEEAEHHYEQGSLLQELEGSNTCAVELSIANRIFPQSGMALEADFEAGLSADYDAPAESLDYSADPEAARLHINSWVSEQTHEKIPDLLPVGIITDMTRLVLANAIYMKADWAEQFDPDQTADAGFLRLDGTEVQVPMMWNSVEEGLSHAHIEGAQLVELPYAGEELSMVVVLPDDSDGLLALEAELSGETVRSWFDALAPAGVNISLPRLEMRSKELLNDPLQALGMVRAFVPGEADFSGISAELELVITAVIHEAFVKIDEEGTEAAAATAVVVGETSAPLMEEVVVDHPFLFLVRDRITDSVVFIGRVADPSAG
jgi:serpin B